MKSIAIIGAGNLGIAIAKGLVRKQCLDPGQIVLTRRNLSPLSCLDKEGFVLKSSNEEAIALADKILLCIQPAQLAGVLDEIKDVVRADQLVISVVAGASIASIRSVLGDHGLVARAMPNTAIAIGESMTCIAAPSLPESKLLELRRLFDALGQTLVIDEPYMQAATVLAASGVAFFMRYLRAASQGGIQMGFEAADAQAIAIQTAKGAAMMINANGTHPEFEIDKVSTPRGCTIEGLNEMEHHGFSSALIKGIMTSFRKITKLS